MDKLNTIKIFLYENKRKLIVIACLLLVMASVTLLFMNKNSYKTESLVYENVLEKQDLEEEKEDDNKEIYYVDVKGAVYVPGVYSLKKGSRVVDAINLAGGIQENADTSILNLSMELSDGMVIVVYTKDEVGRIPEIETQKNKICNGEVKNDACITSATKTPYTKTEDTSKENNTTEATITSKININTASLKELTTLPKIGEAKAQAIIDYRTKNGNFKTIQDIKKVSGIGDATFETLKDNITV